MIRTTFDGALPDSLTPLIIGTGRIAYENGIRFSVAPTLASGL